MIALLQRVLGAHVEVDGATVGAIGGGLLVFLGVERGDSAREAEGLAARVLDYRVFEDGAGRMNRSLRDAGGGLLVVPQFTLAADTRKGLRPSFTPAADPATGEALFGHFVDAARRSGIPVATGRFGATMRVHLVNDGPATFWLEVRPAGGS